MSPCEAVVDQPAHLGFVGPSSRAVDSTAFPVSAQGGEGGGRVKGGAAAEPSEGTLDAPEHSLSLT